MVKIGPATRESVALAAGSVGGGDRSVSAMVRQTLARLCSRNTHKFPPTSCSSKKDTCA